MLELTILSSNFQSNALHRLFFREFIMTAKSGMATAATRQISTDSPSVWSIDSPSRANYLIFGSPQILEPDIEEVLNTLRSCWIGTGPKVAVFEEKIRTYLGARHAAAVHSCTAALHLSMLVVGLKPGDEVIVPSMTFAATANSVVHAGGTPVLADVDRRTMCLDPADLERCLTSRTRAIIPVHFAGRSCDMKAIQAFACNHGLRIIEDCAHAIETTYYGAHAGTLGDLGAFSFYVTKNLVTGEGGMVTTADPAWNARIKTLALHGMTADAWKRFSDEGFKHYEVTEPGFKYNMMDLQAALGLNQIDRLEVNLRRREQIWSRYDRAFADLPVFLPPPAEDNTRHARHLYTLLLDIDRLQVGRDQVQMALHKQNIGTGIHYRALHLHHYYRETFGYQRGQLPNSEWISDRTISLPLSPKLSDEDVASVIFAVRGTLEHFAK
jgi:dTDP-4-amino-4,6-dideoxygalactose transaminase